MKYQSYIPVSLLLSAFFCLGAGFEALGEVPSRISGQLQNGPVFRLTGNVHPLAVPAADQGEAAESLPLPQITIHFKLSASQQSELNRLLEQQQDPSSSQYHRWLTPDEYGSRFGVSQEDLNKVVSWLQASGFTNVQVNRSRTAVSMSGTAALVRSVLGASIHRYQVGGKAHYANSSDPLLPGALAGIVSAIRGLNDFHPRPHLLRNRVAGGPNPRFTSAISGKHFLAPNDFATIYDVQALYNSGFTGRGQKIVIPGQSDITLSDIQAFRSASALATNNPQIITTGPDPGVQSGDESESDLDVEWAGAIAPDATIIFVTATDVFTSVYYAIDNNLAPVLSITYGNCEAQFGSSEVSAAEAAFQQANAEGMTVIAASGDTGAADCDDGSGATPPKTASQGLAVDYPSSSAYVTAMGGTEFNENGGNYWSATNNSSNGSALSYIPEKVWNTTPTDGTLGASGGGRSVLFGKPTWQEALNVPNDGARDTPDLAFAASPDTDAYLICSGGDCVNGFRDASSYLDVVGGTSAATPVFAAVLALLNQKFGTSQGNINPSLYRLANSSSNAFHDIQAGNNQVPCQAGTPDCPNGGYIGYFAGPGYDLATGLGSVDAFNLVSQWSTATGIPALSQVSGSLTQVSVGADGTAWGLNAAGDTFMYDSQTHSWQQVPGVLSQIAVGASGAVWGIDAYGTIYRYDSNNSTWVSIPGNLTSIAVGADGDVWGLNRYEAIYHFNSQTQGWTQIPGSLAQIAVGFDGAVWGLNASQQIYRYNPGTQGFEWVPGSLSQISIGADGEVWGINAGQEIFRFDPLSQDFQRIAGTLAKISVGSATNVWGLDPSGVTYTFDISTQRWNQVRGTLSEISAGADGAVWGTDSSGNTFTYSQSIQSTQAFHYVPGSLAQVAVSTDGNVWGLNGAGQIFTFDRLTQAWTYVPGALAQIAVARDGRVWGINSSGDIYTFNFSAQSWLQTPGELSQIAVGDNGDVWGLNSAHSIYRYNYGSQTWNQVPGELIQISVGSDGTVWGVNAAGTPYRFNAQGEYWVEAPGSFAQIAVGSGTNVWAVTLSGQVYQFDATTQNWNQFPGAFAQISAAFDGAAWALTAEDGVFRFDAQTQNWDPISGALSQVAVGADAAVWGINSGSAVYHFQ